MMMMMEEEGGDATDNWGFFVDVKGHHDGDAMIFRR
jgi:hypothetical protein